MFKQTLLLLVCIFALSHCFEEENNVLILTQENFKSALSTYENVLVEFYAPWCGHCKKLEPEYAKAAGYFKDEGNKIRLAKVDATVETELAKEYEIDGFPTLLMFIEGRESEYTGGRTSNNIIGWIKKKVEIPSVSIDKVSDLETIVQKAELSVVFFGDEFDAGFKIYRRVAGDHMDIPFFHTTSQEIIEKYNPNQETKVILLRNFDEPVLLFEDIFTAENIENFVLKNRYPRMVEYSQKYAKVIFGDRTPALFLMAGRGDSTEKAIQELKAASPELYGKFLITILNTDDESDELAQKVIKYFGTIREDVPALYLFKPATQKERPEKYILEGKINKENILKFYQDFKDKKLLPVPRSDEVPDENNEAVKTIVGKIYRDVVFDEDKDVMVFYSDSGCADCKEFLKEFQGLAKLVLPIEDLILGTIDLDKNEVRDIQFETVPQILLFPRNKKDSPITYKGPRDIKTMFNYFRDYLTVKFDESELNIDESLKAIRREIAEKEEADLQAKKKMEQLAASQNAKEEQKAAADAQAREHAEKYAQENQAERHTQELENKKKNVDTDL